MKGKESKSSNTHSYIASTSDEREILCNKATTFAKDRKRFVKVWLVDLTTT